MINQNNIFTENPVINKDYDSTMKLKLNNIQLQLGSNISAQTDLDRKANSDHLYDKTLKLKLNQIDSIGNMVVENEHTKMFSGIVNAGMAGILQPPMKEEYIPPLQ